MKVINGWICFCGCLAMVLPATQGRDSLSSTPGRDSLSLREAISNNPLREAIYSKSGKVTDRNGEAVVGAAIINICTRAEAVSNEVGYFRFKADSGARLAVSRLGYRSREVVYHGEALLEVVLDEAPLSLREVVATALRVKRGRSVLRSALREVVGGGRVMLNSDGKRSRLTLAGSLAAVEQMKKNYIEITPEGIDSMIVLKGTTAAALYGRRYGYGLAIILTDGGASRCFCLEPLSNAQRSSKSVVFHDREVDTPGLRSPVIASGERGHPSLRTKRSISPYCIRHCERSEAISFKSDE